MREGDAEPDEIAIVPDSSKQPSGSSDDPDEARSPTPGGKPIPVTVVEETKDTDGSKTHEEKKHRADPPPDLVLKADGKLEDGGGGDEGEDGANGTGL